eukprot:TRINITY_DN13477_c0_g1_i1.p1 TRINITY_DN13477_c0_g1~~TRINITY_DN13477_c0_g1_i1.p1  ORF type:complete len:160 (+),score=30.21 TRINITY_DN13477_c0_g1_i1:51-530(+)
MCSKFWFFYILCLFTFMTYSCHFYHSFFFFFKQKTAYEMLRSLVGSEMCIRDRSVWCMPSLLPSRTPPPPPPRWLLLSKYKLSAHLDPHGPSYTTRLLLVMLKEEALKGTPQNHSHTYTTYHTIPAICLLYTSDAADEEDSVDLGGRRIIKKKKKKINT